MPANMENSAVATGLEKVHFTPILKKNNAKECSNYRTIALISHARKVMLKILQAGLQKYVNWELPDIQADLEKVEEPKIKLVTSIGSEKKQGNSRNKRKKFNWVTSNWLQVAATIYFNYNPHKPNHIMGLKSSSNNKKTQDHNNSHRETQCFLICIPTYPSRQLLTPHHYCHHNCYHWH